MQSVYGRIVAAVALAAAAVPSTSFGFSPIAGGDMLVLRVGDGTAAQAVNSYAASVFVDDYRLTAGTWSLFQSVAVPSSPVASALTINSTLALEGGVNISTDGNYFVFTGYRKAAAAGSPTNNTSAGTPRVIGRLTLADGTVDTSTVIKTTAGGAADLYSGGAIRSVTSTDGNHFWVTGTDGGAAGVIASGLTYVPGVGASVASVPLDTVTTRGVGIFAGSLYAETQTGVRKVTDAAGNLPTAKPITTSTFIGAGTGNALVNTENSVMFDLDPTVPGLDTLYAGDMTNSKIVKYALTNPATSPQTWVQVGTIDAGIAANQVAGVQHGSSVTLYFTGTPLPTSPNVMNSFTDTTGYNAAPGGTVGTLITAQANTTMRGMAIVPTAGDVSGDFVLDSDDYALIDRFVAKNGLGAATALRSDGDLNGDGRVDASDYLKIDTAYAMAHGAPSPEFLSQREAEFGAGYVAALTAAVPEPGAVGLLVAGLSAAARRRRR